MNKKIFAANWKMYLNSNESKDFMLQINSNRDFFSEFNIMIFPSHISFEAIQVLAKDLPNIRVGMQDCDILTSGAVTGSNSITSIKADSCLVGHSERRTIFKENDDIIKKKLNNCLEHIESAVLCIGESFDEKEDNQTFEIIKKQLSILPTDLKGKELIVAYEPVWAIGTGLVASKEYIEDVLSYINNLIKELYSNENDSNISLFYGGSVDENSVKELSTIPLLDGFLIGSASADFGKFKNILNKMR
jgi:triosephosphate isomerase